LSRSRTANIAGSCRSENPPLAASAQARPRLRIQKTCSGSRPSRDAAAINSAAAALTTASMLLAISLRAGAVSDAPTKRNLARRCSTGRAGSDRRPGRRLRGDQGSAVTAGNAAHHRRLDELAPLREAASASSCPMAGPVVSFPPASCPRRIENAGPTEEISRTASGPVTMLITTSGRGPRRRRPATRPTSKASALLLFRPRRRPQTRLSSAGGRWRRPSSRTDTATVASSLPFVSAR